MRYSWLFILPIIAIIAIVTHSLYRFYTKQRVSKKAVLISHSKKIRSLPEYEKARTWYRILLALLLICFAASIMSTTMAASRPISVGIVEPDYEARDIMLCVDVSGSTDESREELLDYLSEIVESLKGQRVGITIFATKATLLSPLTNDYASLHTTLDDLRSSFSFTDSVRVSYYVRAVGISSNIGTGVVNCINNFDHLQEEGRSQSIIIATDNVQTEGTITIEKATNYAKRFGISIYGVDTSTVTPGANLNKSSRIYKDAVTNAGGVYYSLGTSNLSVNEVVDEILKQEAIKHDSERQYVQKDSPKLTMIVAAVSTLLFLIIVWRIKL